MKVLTDKEHNRELVKRAKYFHKSSENNKFHSPIYKDKDVSLLLNEKVNFKGQEVPKKNLLFRGNVVIV